MRRADRLFQLVQILRNKRLVTARALAERLEVSERTIYRDIQDLSLSGVPVEGEAGVGYRLRYSLDIPPLQFNAAEIEALVVGARMLTAFGGHTLGLSSRSVLDKVEAALPDELRALLDSTHLYAPVFSVREDLQVTMDICRGAIAGQQILAIDYTTESGKPSQREIKPLGLFFWGKYWTLAAWCDLREDFRTFRLDRMQRCQALEVRFEATPGQTLDDYLASVSTCAPD